MIMNWKGYVWVVWRHEEKSKWTFIKEICIHIQRRRRRLRRHEQTWQVFMQDKTLLQLNLTNNKQIVADLEMLKHS